MGLLRPRTGRENHQEVGDERGRARSRSMGRRSSERRNSCLAIEYLVKTTKTLFPPPVDHYQKWCYSGTVYQCMIDYQDLFPPSVDYVEYRCLA